MISMVDATGNQAPKTSPALHNFGNLGSLAAVAGVLIASMNARTAPDDALREKKACRHLHQETPMKTRKLQWYSKIWEAPAR